MNRVPLIAGGLLAAASVCAASADVFHDYENFDEGFLGETVVHDGVTYRDANRVSGFFPDGDPFDENELGSEFIIERATLWYDEFPGYGSRNNSMTFGRAFVPGDNLSLGPLASIWMDLDEVADAVSLDLGYLENGPWGGIEYILEASFAGEVVARDAFFISDLGGRDNGAFRTMSIDGVEFDQLQLYGWLNDAYTAPRGIIDDLAIRTVPAPGAFLLLVAGGLCPRRRR
jgi:hypothetical protein